MTVQALIEYLKTIPKDTIVKVQEEAPEYGCCAYIDAEINNNVYFNEDDCTIEFGGE